jgi:hypothetical protein
LNVINKENPSTITANPPKKYFLPFPDLDITLYLDFKDKNKEIKEKQKVIFKIIHIFSPFQLLSLIGVSK